MLLQDSPAGWTASRSITARGLSDAAGGVRLFKAELQYALRPNTEQARADGLPEGVHAPAPEVSRVYAFTAPATMLGEALTARRGPRGARGLFSKRKSDAPSLMRMHSGDGERPSWSQAASELHREIAEDLLTHTSSNAVFEDLDGAKGPPAVKPTLEKMSGIILAGHGPGALVAYQATVSLLRQYPEALKGRLKCITFAMPVMGWEGREERDCLLRLIAPSLGSIPLLRRDLPCPHFLHILRQEDLVPAVSLCSRKIRSSVAAALAVASSGSSALGIHEPCHNPYSRQFIDAVLSLKEDEMSSGDRQSSPGDPESFPAAAGFPSSSRQYDSDDSDSDIVSAGASRGEEERAQGLEGEPDEPQRGGGFWKGWKKERSVGVHGSSVQWDVLSRAVRDEVTDVSLPEWWPLGKFWFFCDSEPFDAERATSSGRAQHGLLSKKVQSSSTRSPLSEASSPLSTRRDGTIVRVRRWVVQFPYFLHATSSGRRELFEPFPDSVGLLRDMLSAGAQTLDTQTHQRHSKNRQRSSVLQVRSQHWPVQHHLGQYINALHSWVGSSEWQMSRRRELGIGLSSTRFDIDGDIASDANLSRRSSVAGTPGAGGTARQRGEEARLHSLASIPEAPSSAQLSRFIETPACQPLADAADCACVLDGVKPLLQVSLRGSNLHYVEGIELLVHGWTGQISYAEGIHALQGSSTSTQRTGISNHDVSRRTKASPGVTSADDEAGREEHGSFIRIQMRMVSCGSCRLVAQCDGPYGWVGAGVEARLLGSCIREVRVSCEVSRLEAFRGLHGAAAALENAPACAVLEQALLLQDVFALHGSLAGGCNGSEASVAARAHRSEHDDECIMASRRDKPRRCMPAARQLLLGDVTALGARLPDLDMTSTAGKELVEELLAELTNLEDKTRSQWTDFMRTLSLGGVDPHARVTAPKQAHLTVRSASEDDHEGEESGDVGKRAQCNGPGQSDHRTEASDEMLRHIKADVRAQLRANNRKLACFEQINELLSRPLSLSMDRSPRLKQMMGLTMAMTAGATIMAGSCLLAPYAAASVMPTMAAYVTPAHAVTGMFATSMVGTHMQARCTIDGSYLDKLLHFAAALGVSTAHIKPRELYVEAAIATRVIAHARSVLSLAPLCSLEELLAQPSLFTSLLSHPDSWRRLIDSQHYFEFLDFKDKKFVLDFLWVIVSIHRVRVQLASAVSVALVGPYLHSPIPQTLLRRLFPTVLSQGSAAHLSQELPVEEPNPPLAANACCAEGEGEDREGWRIASYELAARRGLLRLDAIHLPESYLMHSRQCEAGNGISSVDDEQGGSGKSRYAGGHGTALRAEQLRALACCEILVMPWREASQPGSILIMGRLLARRACSAVMPPCIPAYDQPGQSEQAADGESGAEAQQDRAFGFKVLLTGVPREDAGALLWLADKINRKLDVTRWRSFIAVARRRIRMQRPHTVDATFLGTIGREAVQELDLRPADVPDSVDIELLLASRALDDDWLTRPNLQLALDDLLPVHYLVEPDESAQQACDTAQESEGEGGKGAASAGGRTSSSRAKVAPGFSVLSDVVPAVPPQDSSIAAPIDGERDGVPQGGGKQRPCVQASALEEPSVSPPFPRPYFARCNQ